MIIEKYVPYNIDSKKIKDLTLTYVVDGDSHNISLQDFINILDKDSFSIEKSGLSIVVKDKNNSYDIDTMNSNTFIEFALRALKNKAYNERTDWYFIDGSSYIDSMTCIFFGCLYGDIIVDEFSLSLDCKSQDSFPFIVNPNNEFTNHSSESAKIRSAYKKFYNDTEIGHFQKERLIASSTDEEFGIIKELDDINMLKKVSNIERYIHTLEKKYETITFMIFILIGLIGVIGYRIINLIDK